MNHNADKFRDIQPHITSRVSGGWLAATPQGAVLSIGVTGDTEQDAKKRFYDTLDKWAQCINDDEAKPPEGSDVAL